MLFNRSYIISGNLPTHHTRQAYNRMTSISIATTTVPVVQTQTIDSFIVRYRAASTNDERSAIMHEIHAFRAFEALITKHGSVEAARTALDDIRHKAAECRERELASMGAWGQIPGSASTSI